MEQSERLTIILLNPDYPLLKQREAHSDGLSNVTRPTGVPTNSIGRAGRQAGGSRSSGGDPTVRTRIERVHENSFTSPRSKPRESLCPKAAIRSLLPNWLLVLCPFVTATKQMSAKSRRIPPTPPISTFAYSRAYRIGTEQKPRLFEGAVYVIVEERDTDYF